ncbi:MAG TPA: alpha/beta hydrolase [Micromonosporaceae bacterium]
MSGVGASLEKLVLHGLTRLPAGAQRRLAGGGRIVVDGEELDPALQLVLAMRRWRGSHGLTAGTPERTRRKMRHESLIAVREPTPVAAVRDLTVDGAAGPLAARHYAPFGPGPRPLLVFFHGGGFVSGDIDGHDEPCRMLCRHAGVHVLSVAYRLAPEHPFPAGVDDAIAATDWAYAHAEELGADPERVAVGGDSAGASLATVVCLLAVRTAKRLPLAQVLIYPPTLHEHDWASRTSFAHGFLLTAEDIDFCYRHYTVGGVEPHDFRHSPLLAGDLSGLPPTLLVTAAFDPLRDEGEAYAEALAAAGTVVTVWRAHGMIHGFINMTALSRAARDAVIEIAGATRALLASAPVPAVQP